MFIYCFSPQLGGLVRGQVLFKYYFFTFIIFLSIFVCEAKIERKTMQKERQKHATKMKTTMPLWAFFKVRQSRISFAN